MDAIRKTSVAVGLMSGTSMDGIDACVVEITEDDDNAQRLKLIDFLTHPYPAGLKEDLLRICSGGTVQEICLYNVLLGRVFADAARAVVTKSGVEMETIDVIGSHGQTVHHLPTPQYLHGYPIRSTLQIGDPSMIANECGVTTVGDFRLSDIAVGGQGAPLVPYMDEILLRGHYKVTGRLGLLLNIGGISNVSAYIPQDGAAAKFIGFDCGPGNLLIDSLVKRWYGDDFDRDGKIASTGRTSPQLLEELLKDAFLTRPPPKSTGREHYGGDYINKLTARCKELSLSQEDAIATVTEYTAAAVWVNYEWFIRPQLMAGSFSSLSYDLFVSGGGASNPVIMRCLKDKFHNFHVASTAEIGIDPDAKEAVCFALLAYQTCKGRPTNMPSVTGSRKNVLLGKICPVPKKYSLLETVF